MKVYLVEWEDEIPHGRKEFRQFYTEDCLDDMNELTHNLALQNIDFFVYSGDLSVEIMHKAKRSQI